MKTERAGPLALSLRLDEHEAARLLKLESSLLGCMKSRANLATQILLLGMEVVERDPTALIKRKK